MTSKDNQQYLTVEMFNAKMDALMANIQLANEKLHNEIHNEIQDVRADVRANSTQIADLQHSIYWGFAVIAFVVALVPLLREFFKALRKPVVTAEQVQDMIDKAIARAFSSIGK